MEIQTTSDPFTDYFLNNTNALNYFINLYKSKIDQSLQIPKDDLLCFNLDIRRNLFLLMVSQVYEKLNPNKENDYLSYLNWLIIESKNEPNKDIKNMEKIKKKRPAKNIFCVHKIPVRNVKSIKSISITKSRNSNYRGVSKTGNRWQVLLKNKKRLYLGSYVTELEAARVYDYYAIKYFGYKAIKNFVYTDEDKAKLYSESKNSASNIS